MSQADALDCTAYNYQVLICTTYNVTDKYCSLLYIMVAVGDEGHDHEVEDVSGLCVVSRLCTQLG